MKSNQIELSFVGSKNQPIRILQISDPSKLPSKTKFRYLKLLMESCHTFFKKKLVIGLSHVWRTHMVYVH
jgi:hypothetical protein